MFCIVLQLRALFEKYVGPIDGDCQVSAPWHLFLWSVFIGFSLLWDLQKTPKIWEPLSISIRISVWMLISMMSVSDEVCTFESCFSLEDCIGTIHFVSADHAQLAVEKYNGGILEMSALSTETFWRCLFQTKEAVKKCRSYVLCVGFL